jgi:hypothetical protein
MVLPSKVLLIQRSREVGHSRQKKRPLIVFDTESSLLAIILSDQLCGFVETCATFCTSASTTIGIARLFVVFATTHFLLDPSVLYELPKSLHCVLNLLPVSKSQLDHQTPLFLY